MSSKIDERIVAMRFDNAQFEKGIAQTSGSLGELKRALDMGSIADGVQSISSKFSVFGAVAFSAINNVVGMAINAGAEMATALWDPMVNGGKKRALAIEQAKFQFRGLGMDVEATMAAALYAVKGTAFGLDEAASAAANLGASRVPLDKMGESLRAISGVAALAGAEYSDVADVFSKVAGQGRLMGDDLNRLAARGVNAAATLGSQMGITESDVREMVSEGKISFEEFAHAMDSAFGANATKASDTFSGAMSNMRAALSRIGAAFATPDFESQRLVLNALTPAIDNVAAAIKPLIDTFTSFTMEHAKGLVTIFEALNFSSLPNTPPPFFQALTNVVEFLLAVVRPIKDAFQEIFPSATAENIKDMAFALLAFTQGLKMGAEETEQLKRTFKGVFAVFDIVRIIVGQLVEGIVKLFSGIDGGNTSFLEITANIGDFLVKLRDAIERGDLIVRIFEKIRGAIDWLVTGFNKLMDTMFGGLADTSAPNPFEFIQNMFQNFIDWLPRAGQWIKEAWGNITEAFQGAFSGISFEGLFNTLSVGLITGAVVMVANFIRKIPDMFGNIGGGIIDTIKGAFTTLTDTMQAMQAKLKADALIRIAIAIGLLTVSLVALSFIDAERLSSSLAAMTVMFIQLMGGLILMEKFTSGKGLTKMTVLTGVLIGMATAMVIFAAAVTIMAQMDWVELARGLSGMAVGLILMIGALTLVSKMKGSIAKASGALFVLSTSLLILATAMKIMASLSWEDIARGMSVTGAALAVLVGAMALMKKGAVGAGSMILIAVAVNILAGALKIFATMDWDEIGRSVTVLAATMGILVGAMALAGLLGGPGLLGAAAMVIVAGAITILTGAMKIMATMSWEEIGKSLTVLAGSLAILAGAMALMGIPIVLLGSIGIVASAAALMMLAPALKILGTMSWDDIGRGLTMLGGALAILAVGGLLMIPASAGFLLLGAGILAIGGGILMAAEGLLIFSVAITALAAAAAIGAEGIKMAVTTLFDLIPIGMAKFGEGLIAFAEVIAGGGAAFIEAAKTLIGSFLTAIAETGPQIIDTIWTLVVALKDKVVEGIPMFAEAALAILVGLLTSIRNNMGQVISLGTEIIVKFIQGIGNAYMQIVTAAAETVLKFVNGIGAGIERYSYAFQAAGRRIFRAIVDGVASAITNGGADLAWAGQRIGNSIIEGAKNALSINSPSKVFRDDILPSVFEGIEDGTDKNLRRAENSGSAIGDGMLNAAKKSIEQIADAVASDMNLNPTIKPVLDLSAVRSDASLIGGMLQKPSLSVDSQYASAASVAVQARTNEQALNDSRYSTGAPTVVKEFKFEQTLNSPKALSRIEIYRQSKNLYSAAKEALNDDQVG